MLKEKVWIKMNGKINSDMPILWNEVFSRWTSVLKSLSDESHWTFGVLMISQHWFRWWLGTSGNKPLPENQCQPRSLSSCGFTTLQGLNSAVPMKHNYCFKQESCFHFVNPGTAMITTVSGGLLMASRYITRTRHCVIKTNRGWKNHGLTRS